MNSFLAHVLLIHTPKVINFWCTENTGWEEFVGIPGGVM